MQRRRYFRYFFLVIGFLSMLPPASQAKTFYLDGNLSGNCSSGNYSISNRSCSGSDGYAYNSISGALSNLSPGDLLYVRAGSYYRTTNNYSVGALDISVSGTSGNHTVVKNYGTEQPVIYTAPGKMNYNPNPGDSSYSLSSHYYPNPAITIGGHYVDVIGMKTYGQVVLGGNNSSIQNSDLGGGGPNINQGQVVMIYGRNVLVKNNRIHHSCWGESKQNGAALMGYRFSATIENNEFYDNYGSDIRYKDAAGTYGDTSFVRFNVFRPSSISSNAGFEGIAQYDNISYIYIHNNIFFRKNIGIQWKIPASIATIAYNNTFIDCGTDIEGGNIPSINSYNNLFYHTNSGSKYYDFSGGFSLGNLNSNHNLYYSSPGSSWSIDYRNVASSLSGWKGYSGKDGNSISKSPGFLNPGGTLPSDFKRSSYAGEVSGSSYGTVCGAYETGSEIIGTGAGTAPPPSLPPSPSSPSATAGDSRVTVQWILVPGATSYNIYWSTSPGVTVPSGTLIQNVATPYAHSGLSNGTTYYYVITAENSAGESLPSSEVSATPQAVTSKIPNPPTIMTIN